MDGRAHQFVEHDVEDTAIEFPHLSPYVFLDHRVYLMRLLEPSSDLQE